MKAKVFLRQDKEFKSVVITDANKTVIEDDLQKKWQRILDIISALVGVSVALLMKISKDSMTVTLSNNNNEHLYSQGDSEFLGSGLYCETVIGKNRELYIKNALEDTIWKDNPNMKLDMISYYGLPIQWPDGEAYGTICILDQSEIKLIEPQRNLMREFKNVIEEDLNSMIRREQFKTFFEVNLDLLCITNLQGDFIKVNKAWEELLDYSVASLETMNFFDLLHPDDLDTTKHTMKELLEKKKITHLVNRYRDKEGEYHFIEWSSNIHMEGEYIYASARDITKQRRQKDELTYQKEFHKMISDISLTLLTMDTTNIDEIMSGALDNIKIFFKEHRGYIIKHEKGLADFSDIYIKLMHRIQKAIEEKMESNTRLKDLNSELQREMAKKNTYQIAFLKSQIKPHFLFNTLSSILNLCEEKPERAHDTLEKLAGFLKHNYEISPSTDYSIIKKELEQIDLYMYIQKERFQERISFEAQYNENILNYKIPHLMIQPLIENALLHGILKRIEGGLIILQIIENEKTLDIIVSDDGIGFNRSLAIRKKASSGIGLSNINKRLKYLFNEELNIKSKNGKTVISFTIPKILQTQKTERILYD